MNGDNILNDHIFLSVIIPVYNGEKYLSQAINSVLNQPCKNLQVIVVDDGSTDSSLKIAKQIAENDNRVTALSQTRGGVSAARNYGINIALEHKTSYIGFLDSDDVWCKDFYTVDLQKELINNFEDLCIFSYYNGNEDLTKGNKADGALHFCSCLYKASLFKKYNLRFPVGIKLQEDVAFSFLFKACMKSSKQYEKNIFIYRSNSKSVVHTKFDADNKFFNHIIQAWVFVENELKRIEEHTGYNFEKEQRQCKIMKKTYAVEFLKCACGQGMKITDINELMNSSDIAQLLHDDSIWLDDKSKELLSDFCKHPYLIWLKYRTKSAIFYFMRLFRRNPIIEKYRYPINLSNISNI